MFKTQQIKTSIGITLLALAAFASACSTGTTTAQTPRARTAESSPTPEYKPPKRVSRDIIKTETKDEPVKPETKNQTVKIKAK